MNQTFIPADATLAELQKKAADCEQRAMQEKEQLATALREEAKGGLRHCGQEAGRRDRQSVKRLYLASAGRFFN
jgi:hypothetical protein